MSTADSTSGRAAIRSGRAGSRLNRDLPRHHMPDVRLMHGVHRAIGKRRGVQDFFADIQRYAADQYGQRRQHEQRHAGGAADTTPPSHRATLTVRSDCDRLTHRGAIRAPPRLLRLRVRAPAKLQERPRSRHTPAAGGRRCAPSEPPPVPAFAHRACKSAGPRASGVTPAESPPPARTQARRCQTSPATASPS